MVSPVASQRPLSTSPRFGFLEQMRPNQRSTLRHPGSLGPKSWGVGCGLTRCAIWGSGVFLPTLTLLSFPQFEVFFYPLREYGRFHRPTPCGERGEMEGRIERGRVCVPFARFALPPHLSQWKRAFPKESRFPVVGIYWIC